MSTAVPSPASSSRAGSPASQASSGKKTPPAPMTNFERTVRLWYDEGFVKCKRADHYRQKRLTPADVAALPSDQRQKVNMNGAKSYPIPVHIGSTAILEMMPSYKEASCVCERDACRQGWSMNAPGIYQNQFVAPGAFTKGVGKVSDTFAIKRVMPVNFRLSEVEFKTLLERFPDWLFVQVANGGHDHPISHVTAQIASFEAVTKLSGKRVLDVHGNPSANEATQAQRGANAPRFTTVVSLETPKDFLRQATKWGPEMRGQHHRYHVAAGLRDIADHPARLAHDKDAFLSVHTLYYYPMKEIANMLACSPGAPMTAIMHRFEGSSGSFNGGELSWVKDEETGAVTQTNVKTGERYTHPDNSHWFSTSSWTRRTALEAHTRDASYDRLDSLTWTTNMVCEGTYILTIVPITSRAAHLDPLRLSLGTSTDAVKRWGGVDIRVGDETVFVPIPTTHAAMFDELRAKMNFKVRDEKKFAAHVNTCESKAMLHKKENNLATSADVLRRIQLASFWVDFHDDAASMADMHVKAAWIVRDQSLLSSAKSMKNPVTRNAHIFASIADLLRATSVRDATARAVDNAIAYHMAT